MAEKNTLSILESIRKKIQKLDEPRTSENKDFSDIGDEFDYAAPAKKIPIVPAENVEAVASAKPEQTKADDAIEREITESFEAADDEDVEENHAVETAAPDDIDFEFEENFLDEEATEEAAVESEAEVLEEDAMLEPEEHEVIETDHEIPQVEEEYEDESVIEEHVVAEEELEIEEEPVLEEDTTEEEEHLENLEAEDDFELEDDFGEGEQLEEELEEVEQNIVEEAPQVVKPLEQAPAAKIQEANSSQQAKKSDEDELEELLRQEASLKIKENKVVPPVNAEPLAAVAPVFPAYAQISQQQVQTAPIEPAKPMSQPIDATKKVFTNVDEFLTHTSSDDSLLSQQATSNITDSIKKLVDAKNVVSGVTSFSKSEAFADIAAQLMEPRLEKWLNEHLPALVESIVREEIKKIIPKE